MNTNNNQRPSHDDDIELLPVSLGTSVDSTDDDVVVVAAAAVVVVVCDERLILIVSVNA